MSSHPPVEPDAPRTELSPDRAANLAENPHAGQGAVMLDVGGDIGAIVLYLSQDLEGAEIEIRPAGAEATSDHPPEPEHDHEHDHGHDHNHGHAPHVAVVGRPSPGSGILYSAVFPDLEAGVYRLSQAGETASLDVTVEGGAVAEVTWPH